MLSTITIVGLQLVKLVDNCNYHNCIMGPFSVVPCPEGQKTGICPQCTGPFKKRLYNYNNGKSMYYRGNYATILTSYNTTIIMAECIF